MIGWSMKVVVWRKVLSAKRTSQRLGDDERLLTGNDGNKCQRGQLEQDFRKYVVGSWETCKLSASEADWLARTHGELVQFSSWGLK